MTMNAATMTLIAVSLLVGGEAYASHGKGGPITLSIVFVSAVTAFVFGVLGRLWLNAPSAILLAKVGGTLGAGIYHNIAGAIIGLVIGWVVIVLPNRISLTTYK